MNPIQGIITTIDWMGLPFFMLGILPVGFKLAQVYGWMCSDLSPRRWVATITSFIALICYGIPAFHWFYENFWGSEKISSVMTNTWHALEVLENNGETIAYVVIGISLSLSAFRFIFRVTLLMRNLHVVDSHYSKSTDRPNYSEWTMISKAQETLDIKVYHHFGVRCISISDLALMCENGFQI